METEDWALWQKASLDEARRCVPEDPQLAEELAGRAMEKILGATARPTAAPAIRSYARAVVRNVFADRQRKVQFRAGGGIHYDLAESAYQDVAQGKVAVTVDRVQQGQIYDVVHADEEAWALKNLAILIEELPIEERELFKMHLAGTSPADIAVKLQYKDAKTVTTRVGQIRKKLADSFHDRWSIQN